MLDTHLGPGFRLFEVKICHSPLDIDYVEYSRHSLKTLQ